MTEPRIIATIDAAVIGRAITYREMLVVYRNRIEELGTHMGCLDDLTCLPDGYFSKVLAPIHRKVRRLVDGSTSSDGRVLGPLSWDGLNHILGIEWVAIAKEPHPKLERRRGNSGTKIENTAKSDAKSLANKKRRLHQHKCKILQNSRTRSRIARNGGLERARKLKKKSEHATYMREWRKRKLRRELRDQFMEAAARGKKPLNVGCSKRDKGAE